MRRGELRKFVRNSRNPRVDVGIRDQATERVGPSRARVLSPERPERQCHIPPPRPRPLPHPVPRPSDLSDPPPDLTAAVEHCRCSGSPSAWSSGSPLSSRQEEKTGPTRAVPGATSPEPTPGVPLSRRAPPVAESEPRRPSRTRAHPTAPGRAPSSFRPVGVAAGVPGESTCLLRVSDGGFFASRQRRATRGAGRAGEPRAPDFGVPPLVE